MKLTLKIDNVYDDGVEITTTPTIEVPDRPVVDTSHYYPEEMNKLDDWEEEVSELVEEATGAERFAGNDEGLERTPDAGYFVEVTESSDPVAIPVGRKWEFGL